MRRLEDLGARQLAHRRGRSVLTSLGIVLGVAVLFGVQVTGASVHAGVSRLVRTFTGSADVAVVPVGDFGATLPASTVTTLSRVPGVAVASGSLEFAMKAVLTPRGSATRYLDVGLPIQGIDAASARVLSFAFASGRAAQPGADEIVLGPHWLHNQPVPVGSQVTVTAPTGPRTLTVVGILADQGAAKADNGKVAFTSLATMQHLDGVADRVDHVAVVLRHGTSVNSWLAAHGRVVPGATLESVGDFNASFASVLNVIQGSMDLFAGLALFVGAFLIYLTLTVAITERTKVYGTLRALGATPRQVRRVVVTEAVTLGAVSSALGLVLGLGIGAGLTRLMSSLVRLGTPPLQISPAAIVVSLVMGVIVTVLASLLPARRAARLSPVSAMRGGMEAAMRPSRAWIVGAVSVTLGVVSVGALHGVAAATVGSMLILLGSVLVVPPLLPVLARLVGRLSGRAGPGVGPMAVTHLVKERSRSAYTLGLVMVVLAQALVMGTINASMNRALRTVLSKEFGSDLQVSGGRGPIAPATEATVVSTPGVGPHSELWFGSTKAVSGTQTSSAFMMMVDPASYFRVAGFAWADGDDASARAALSSGDQVLLPNALAQRFSVRRGGTVSLQTSSGLRPFTVAGTYDSFSTDPAIVAGIATGRARFGAGLPGSIVLNVAPGASVEQVRLALDHRLGLPPNRSDVFSLRGLAVGTSSDIKAAALKQLNGFFLLFYAVLGVALLAGLAGLANTLAMSVVQRYREIGVLRAVGTLRRQVAAMVVVESATLVLVALVLSLPLGVLLSAVTVGNISSALGFSVTFAFPWIALPVLAAIAVIVGLLAAIAPARRAGRLEIVSALAFE